MKQKDIRQQIMKERGITTFKEKKKHSRIRHAPRTPIDPKLKTPMMRYFELKTGKDIEDILLSGSLSHVAKTLDNEVDVSTISKWIKRLKLRYGEDNLPECDGCSRRGAACEGGVCYILVELGLYELLQAKREEMFE